MTSDENFQIIKRIEIETEKRKYTKNEKENIQKNTVAKARKIKATMKTKAQRNGVKKSNPKLSIVSLETFTSILPDWLR